MTDVHRRWVWRICNRPAAEAWAVLASTRYWPVWGPSVAAVDPADAPVRPGLRGRVRTPIGIGLPFVVTDVEEGERWSWSVAGVPATDHRVEALGPDACRVGIGVPWPARPYLAVCRVGLRRLVGLVEDRG